MKRLSRGAKVPFSIRLPAKTYEALCKASIDDDISMTALIDTAVSWFLKVRKKLTT